MHDVKHTYASHSLPVACIAVTQKTVNVRQAESVHVAKSVNTLW